MKTRLLLTLTLLITGCLVFAQSLELSFEGETLEPNAQINVEGPAADPEIVAYLTVANNGNASIDVLCQRYEMDLVSGALSAICWGGLCYGPTVSLSPLSTTISAGSSTDEFSGHYYPNGFTGMSTIAYTFFDMNNPDDSVMVTVMFDGLTVGIDNPVFSEGIDIFPNPADDYVNIDVEDLNLSSNLRVRLTDSKGSVVLLQTLQTGTTRLNTGGLPSGMYFLNAYDERQIVASKKILIKH